MIETALHAHLVARGAVHADDRGVLLPVRFGTDAAAEYAALREHIVSSGAPGTPLHPARPVTRPGTPWDRCPS